MLVSFVLSCIQSKSSIFDVACSSIPLQIASSKNLFELCNKTHWGQRMDISPIGSSVYPEGKMNPTRGGAKKVKREKIRPTGTIYVATANDFSAKHDDKENGYN